MKTAKGSRGRGKRRQQSAPPYPVAFRLKGGAAFLEEGYRAPLLAQEFGISACSVCRWARICRQLWEAGLASPTRSSTREGLSSHVTAKIVEIRREQPGFGARRISELLKRVFLVGASPTTLHEVIAGEGYESCGEYPLPA